MRLFHKLVLLMLAAALLPLAALGMLSAHSAEVALRRRIEEHHLKLAQNGADAVALYLDQIVLQLRAFAQYPNLRGTPEVVRGLMRVVYRQMDDITAVLLVGADGRPRSEAVFLADPQKFEPARAHEPATAADIEDLLARTPGRPNRLPLEQVAEAGLALGPVHGTPAGSRTRIVIAVALPKVNPSARGDAEPLILVADVSLRALGSRIAELSSAGAEALLLDKSGRVVADAAGARVPWDPQHAAPASRARSVDHPQVVGDGAKAVAYPYLEDEVPMLGGFAPVRGYAFGVLVRQTAAAAYAPVTTLHRRTLEGLALSAALAAALAALFTRSVVARVKRLAASAAELGHGMLDARIAQTGRDEIGDLGRSMNDMAVRLARQRDEILEWNRTLEKRVVERTRELREAQELLLRSQKLAAIGQLGAGFAHEINNPLAGVLGQVQLLLLEAPGDDPRRKPLQDIEKQATRIKEIVSSLLRFTQRSTGEFRVDESFDLRAVLDQALALIDASLTARGIVIVKQFAGELPCVRGVRKQIEDAFVQILSNARNAMPQGGELRVEAAELEGKLVTVRIGDTGVGIKPEFLDRIFDPFFTTKSDWGATGLGLSIVHRVVEAHGGKITVESAVGRGSLFTLTFPADTGAPNLV